MINLHITHISTEQPGQAVESDGKESIAVIGKLFIKSQTVMDEMTAMIESSIKAPVHKDTDEFDRALFKVAYC